MKSNNASAFFILAILFFNALFVFGQDSIVNVEKKIITLKEVVVRSKLDVPSFIRRVQFDTSFYKAFRNLHVLGYTSLNDVQLFDKKAKSKASLSSRTRQHREKGCRWNEIVDEKTTGDFYNKIGRAHV